MIKLGIPVVTKLSTHGLIICVVFQPPHTPTRVCVLVVLLLEFCYVFNPGYCISSWVLFIPPGKLIIWNGCNPLGVIHLK